MKRVGNRERGEIEARYQIKEYPSGPRETVLDEVVAEHASVHLEAMDDNEFALIIRTAKESACFLIGAKRAPVRTREFWRERNRPKAARKRA